MPAGGRAWWRAYAEAAHDPKLRRLSAKMFRHWFQLMCLACRQDDGLLPGSEDTHDWLRLRSVNETKYVLETLHKRGLLDERDGRYTPHNWSGRQYVSDISTERVKRFRQRSRNGERNAPEQSRAEQTVSEVKETSETVVAASPLNGRKRPPAKKSGTRLPDDWEPSEGDLAYARQHLPDWRVPIEVEKFRAHWHESSRPTAVKRSWRAAWTKWVLTAMTQQARKPPEVLI